MGGFAHARPGLRQEHGWRAGGALSSGLGPGEALRAPGALATPAGQTKHQVQRGQGSWRHGRLAHPGLCPLQPHSPGGGDGRPPAPGRAPSVRSARPPARPQQDPRLHLSWGLSALSLTPNWGMSIPCSPEQLSPGSRPALRGAVWTGLRGCPSGSRPARSWPSLGGGAAPVPWRGGRWDAQVAGPRLPGLPWLRSGAAARLLAGPISGQSTSPPQAPLPGCRALSAGKG